MGGMDVLVVGVGPAGLAVAGACVRRGLATAVVDPGPDRPWTATYGMWSRELPGDLPDTVVAARAAGRAIAETEHQLGWEYAVLDVPALLCEGDQCPVAFANRIVYRDASHLTVAITRLTTPYLAWVVDETLQGRMRTWGR